MMAAFLTASHYMVSGELFSSTQETIRQRANEGV
jgi:hypothetical protein